MNSGRNSPKRKAKGTEQGYKNGRGGEKRLGEIRDGEGKEDAGANRVEVTNERESGSDRDTSDAEHTLYDGDLPDYIMTPEDHQIHEV